MMATASITIDTGREPVLPVGTNRFEYYQAVWHSQPPVYPSSYTTASVLTAVFCSIPYGVYALAATRQVQSHLKPSCKTLLYHNTNNRLRGESVSL